MQVSQSTVVVVCIQKKLQGKASVLQQTKAYCKVQGLRTKRLPKGHLTT